MLKEQVALVGKHPFVERAMPAQRAPLRLHPLAENAGAIRLDRPVKGLIALFGVHGWSFVARIIKFARRVRAEASGLQDEKTE